MKSLCRAQVSLKFAIHLLNATESLLDSNDKRTRFLVVDPTTLLGGEAAVRNEKDDSSMANEQKSYFDDVEHLMRNAQLRDELEPYLDESIGRVDVREFSTPQENEFLASMLAWERAPVLPISDWFRPRLVIPNPDQFEHDAEGEASLHEVLWDTIYKLFEQRIVLDFTDHLSDRQLYCLIYRDILPSQEKKLDGHDSYLHWDCADAGGNPEIWLRYYASSEEREEWDCDEPLPAREKPPFPRTLPRRPL